MKVTLQALRRAAQLPNLEAALEQEFATSCAFLRAADFAEGIRAQVIDKDRSPRWDPPTLPQVDAASVGRFFPAREVAAGPQEQEARP
ncbi:MAG: enoyl-CoA hydratase/isomerase family protein [Patulibacter minatonensis]